MKNKLLINFRRVLDLSLYIHIPFCQTKCPYCDFNTYAKIEHLISPYVEALCQELLFWSSNLENGIIETIFFGGGTPSYLPTNDLKKILDTVWTNFQCDTSEITIEVNPNDIEDANIDGLSGNFRLGSSEAGITFEGPISIINNKETSFIFSVRRSYLQFLFKAFGFSFLPDYWDYQMKIRHKIDDYNYVFDGKTILVRLEQ